MNIIVTKNYEEMSKKAAELMAEVIKSNPSCVLGLATGDTPIGMYNELVAKYDAGELDFSAVRSVNLDEYYPISPDNDQSYRYFMNTHLFNHIDIDKNNTNVPDGTAADPDAEGERYEKVIESLGGVDIQVLGIGRNGHIAFNEPDKFLIPDTHVTGLTEDTIKANSRFFEKEEDVPTRALTMGIGSILRAKKIIILANGVSKKDAISVLLSGKVTTSCPASFLNLHSDVTLICDKSVIE